jgi:hypothetical protein
MTESIAQIVILLAAAYLAVGVVFALLIAAGLWRRLEPRADAGTLGFRVLIVPAAALIWPWLLPRVLRTGGRKTPA